jgi:hypothetical protein
MKKSISLLSAVLAGILVTTIFSCQDTPKETCLQDEFCTSKMVTACCDDNNVCVYKYNGKEYTEDEKDQLAIDLGCGTGKGALKSTGQVDDYSDIVAQLKALMNKVKGLTRSSN